MDLFQQRYFATNTILLKSFGMWPYQSMRVRVVGTVVSFFSTVSLLVPQLIILMEHLDDRDFIMECAVTLILGGKMFARLFTVAFNSRKMLQLLNLMRSDWEVWSRDHDMDILHEYAEKGRKMTILYTVVLIITCVIFITTPVIPKVVDILLKNGTETGQFPVFVDYYYFDAQQYYFYVVLHCSICAFAGFLMAAAFESLFMVYVQHGCGLFAILRHKLERLEQNQVSAESGDVAYGSDKPAMAVEYLAWCIDKHNHAIEYAELLDATYSWFFFFMGVIHMLLISVEGVQIIEKLNEPKILIKFVCGFIVSLAHVYIDNYMGQILIDHSVSIRDYILQGKWYMLPLKSRKLLPMIMMRCTIPCKLTAANLSFMSMETFGVILKTSMSYFTVLHSV